MRKLIFSLFFLLLVACATTPVTPPSELQTENTLLKSQLKQCEDDAKQCRDLLGACEERSGQ